MESCWWPGNEATCLVFNFVLSRKSPTNLVVHVHVCDVGVEKGRRGGGGGGGGGGKGSTSLIAMYLNLNDVAQLVRIT